MRLIWVFLRGIRMDSRGLCEGGEIERGDVEEREKVELG